MPTFSRPDRLRDNLTRLQSQTYPNIEIIVVNAAGTPVDNIVATFPNARLINRDVNTGHATAPRMAGYAEVKGEFITFLDDDDFFFPHHVAKMVNALQGGLMVAYCDWLIRVVEVNAAGSETVLGWDLIKNDGLSSYEMLVTNPVGYMTIFARREAYETVGCFDAACLGGEELELWLRLASRYDYVHVDEPNCAYTIRRTWDGQATIGHYKLWPGGYEEIYRRFPAHHLPNIAARRIANVAELRKTERPAPYPPRYAPI
jgi:glycosyltransferase involved in cell wall biosynthesis